VKLTWFGGMALRVYVGGQIVVVDPDAAPAEVDRGELLAGADRVVGGNDVLPVVDPATWRTRPVPRMTEEGPVVEVARLGDALLVAVAGEPPLVILGEGTLPRFGRWAERAVIVLTTAGEGLVAEVTGLLDVARPRLLALAVDQKTLEPAIAAISAHLDGTVLVSLEPGLALEV
jgi:hypothetical protein